MKGNLLTLLMFSFLMEMGLAGLEAVGESWVRMVGVVVLSEETRLA